MYYKYSGAGNTFAIVDGRDEDPTQLSSLLTPESIELVCTELTTDGMMVLKASEAHDFAMEYYNRDGSGGMMCGNGGRCITAFADHVGIKPADGKTYHFEAPDGVHTAEILSRDGYECVVRLGMLDVPEIVYYRELSEAPVDGYFLNTGTRHFVVFDEDVDDIAVNGAGRVIRHCKEFAPEGTNVNFVCPYAGGLKVRTFEKGVEEETMACGTGVVASAIAAYRQGIEPSSREADGRVRYKVRARIADLTVDYIPGTALGGDASEGASGNVCPPVATSVFLTGPASLIYMV